MPQKLLIIDDSEPIHLVVKARLRREDIEVHSAYDGESGLTVARSLRPDLILLDVEMPQPDGFEVCRRLKSDPLTMDSLVIFVTGAGSTEEKIRGMDLGAVDYIAKPFEPAELRVRVRSALRTKYLIDLLARKAMIDALTGLWNRAHFDQRLTAETSRAARDAQDVSCIMLDVDHFKAVNDQHGHRAGDDVLRTLGRVLMEGCRGEDVVCRYGGEEFVILTPGVALAGAHTLAERLRREIASTSCNDGQGLCVSCSFGVADTHTTGGLSLVEAADRALYEAKRQGRDRVVCASPVAAVP